MTPAELVRRYLSAFASGDATEVASLVTDDFFNDHTAALGSSCRGRDEYLKRLPGFLSSMEGLRYEVDDVIVDGERVAATYTLHATVNSRPIAVRGMMRFEVRDGLIARRTDYWDSLVFRQQAGLA